MFLKERTCVGHHFFSKNDKQVCQTLKTACWREEKVKTLLHCPLQYPKTHTELSGERSACRHWELGPNYPPLTGCGGFTWWRCCWDMNEFCFYKDFLIAFVSFGFLCLSFLDSISSHNMLLLFLLFNEKEVSTSVFKVKK